VNHAARAVVFAVVVSTGSGAALAGSAPIDALPSAAAIDALDTLALPSYPLPAIGDQQIGDHRWARPGTCDVARAGYHAVDAPLPAGSVLTDDVFGSIVVQSPYGTAAVMFEEQFAASRCAYSIEREPTVKARVPGLVVADQFSPVACTSILGIDVTLVTLMTDQGEWTGFAAQLEGEPFKVSFAPGTKAVVSKLKDLPANGIEASGAGTLVDEHLSFTGTSAGGPVTLEATCTPDQLLQQPVA